MQSHPTPLFDRLISAPLKATSRNAMVALVGLALLIASASISSAQTVTATKDDGLPAATKVNPGANVNYTIQINATVSDATGVTLTDPTAGQHFRGGGQSQRHSRGAERHVSAERRCEHDREHGHERFHRRDQ